MLKVKHERDCDCVVAGFRWHKKGGRTAVGSLLLGLYDDSGALQHVGVCASFTEKKRRELGIPRAIPQERARRSPLKIGPSMDLRMKLSIACLAAKAAGVRARTCPGSRYVPS